MHKAELIKKTLITSQIVMLYNQVVSDLESKGGKMSLKLCEGKNTKYGNYFFIVTIFVFAAASTLVFSSLSGCGNENTNDEASEWLESVVYLGMNIPGNGVVSEAQFQDFLENVVSKEFPLGITVFDSYGQMQKDDGEIEKQLTKVILIVHANNDEELEAVNRIIDEYRRRFGTPQAMHTKTEIYVEFFQSDLSRVAEREEVVSFVEEAFEFAESNGKDLSLAEFSNQNGSFKRGELYIYAYDFEGNVLAHGGDASLIGKNLIDYEDPNGTRVIEGLIEVAENGKGWFAFTWDNPQTNRQEPKLGYVIKVDDDWWLGSGTYESFR